VEGLARAQGQQCDLFPERFFHKGNGRLPSNANSPD